MESTEDASRWEGFRVRFPEAEAKEPWLPLLLDAYAVLDAGLAGVVAASGRRPACRQGCSACCRQYIPASSLEVLGLMWCALSQTLGRARHALGRALQAGAWGLDCPFLVDGDCTVYALRPMACREFVVFGRACRPGEEPALTRPGDMLPLPARVQEQAFWIMLPFYGVAEPAKRGAALRNGRVLRDTGILQERDWSWLTRALLERG